MKAPVREHETGAVGRKRRRSHRGDETVVQVASPAVPSTTPTAPPPAKRGRRPLTAQQRAQRAASADTQTHTSDDENQPIVATASHQTPPRHSPRPSQQHHAPAHPRYNFLVELDPSMDAVTRIALLQQRLQDLRKTYNDVKSELACIDRRRKKLRRRERDLAKQGATGGIGSGGTPTVQAAA